MSALPNMISIGLYESVKWTECVELDLTSEYKRNLYACVSVCVCVFEHVACDIYFIDFKIEQTRKILLLRLVHCDIRQYYIIAIYMTKWIRRFIFAQNSLVNDAI